MKKLLLLGGAVGSVLLAGAQSVSVPQSKVGKIPAHYANMGAPAQVGVTDNHAIIPATPASGTYVKANKVASTHTVIGTTTYDLQTNYAIQNRILNHGDGTISAVWTMSSSGDLASPDRGTGYNYYNGTSWMPYPTARVETSRTGWPSIVTVSGAEAIVSHTGLTYNVRAAKGTGSWTQSTITGINGTWPRMIVGGANGMTLHLLSNTNAAKAGLSAALEYSRSTNGGLSWDIVTQIIPGLDSSATTGVNGDVYAIDARGDVVAFVTGGQMKDLVLFKSTDNGTNWNKKILWKFPIDKYTTVGMVTDTNMDGTIDTIMGNDGSLAILLDQNNNAHVFCGRMRVLDSDTTTSGTTSTSFTYFPYTEVFVITMKPCRWILPTP